MVNMNQQTLTWVISLSICVGVILCLFIIFFVIKACSKKQKKVAKINVDEAFITSLYEGLGGKDNIDDVSIDNGRLKFAIKDLDLINSEILKTLSTSGVFITGKNVKLLFKYDSEEILKLFLERRG